MYTALYVEMVRGLKAEKFLQGKGKLNIRYNNYNQFENYFNLSVPSRKLPRNHYVQKICRTTCPLVQLNLNDL